MANYNNKLGGSGLKTVADVSHDELMFDDYGENWSDSLRVKYGGAQSQMDSLIQMNDLQELIRGAMKEKETGYAQEARLPILSHLDKISSYAANPYEGGDNAQPNILDIIKALLENREASAPTKFSLPGSAIGE